MSNHYKFEIHVKTRGELDSEKPDVKDLAEIVATLARGYARGLNMEATVTEVERT